MNNQQLFSLPGEQLRDPLLRSLVGMALRDFRLRQERTIREVAANSSVSAGYLSEIERGQKEASSELLAAICETLEVSLLDVITYVGSLLSLSLHTRALAEIPYEVERVS